MGIYEARSFNFESSINIDFEEIIFQKKKNSLNQNLYCHKDRKNARTFLLKTK